MKKGTKLSNETRKKMSDVKKGKIPKNINIFINSVKHKMTDEEKLKRSIEYKERGICPPSRKGIESWNKGKTNIYSPETINKISKKVTEYLKNNPIVFTEEIRKKIGETHKGDKCTFWKGGISKMNRTERQKDMLKYEYRKWRRNVFERDNFTCQICFNKGGILYAHHIKRYIDYPELRLEISNGITVCKECNLKKVNHKEKQMEQYFFTNLKSRDCLSKEMLLSEL
jgi:hypothetical protein